MFDPITAALIATSPQFSGLDLEGLPKRLTEAYADIVAARINLRGQPGDASENLTKTLTEMRRLAAAQEAYVALLPDRDNRKAAAFVAASAHQACLISAPSESRSFAAIDGISISPEICAALLFLAADAHADAAECAKKIVISEARLHHVDGVLLTAIKHLCQGRLSSIREQPNPELSEEDSSERAVESLFLELYKGVKNLAARLLTRVDVPIEQGGDEPATEYFNRVKSLSIGSLGDVFDTENDVYNLFPGPLHLANLLLAAERDLIESAITRIASPPRVAEDAWWTITRRMAKKRPYLWRNHLQAINSDYLNVGISAALSFPTGGGKSTLAELKIATALLRDKKVIFLAPTHALVDQTTRALKDTFDTFEIIGDVEEDASTLEVVELPEVIVTTPERCLMLLSMQPEAFADLGLVVFDECHLLHPREPERSRRGVDAMLAVLNLAAAAPEADFLLLSAMMKNAVEIAEWLNTMTARPCLSLDLAWKPTRQVRGCLVYPAKRIEELEAILARARIDNSKHKSPPAGTKRSLTALPFGFFSLLQTWATQDRGDYALLPLLSSPHHLSTSTIGGWHLTPNGNHTSALIAASSAASGMKTLVFVQTIPQVESAARDFRDLLDVQPVTLSDEESQLYTLASEEMGGSEFCYLDLSENGKFCGGALGHHSLLLREERLLHESLFKRAPGVNVLFATSTLAQGMNLPSEVVIISGDSRFDPTEGKLAQLEAHELLNAAGRAGRAGESSQGFVLVVPSHVVSFDDQANLIGRHWMKLQSIFSQSDQCLVIDDPLTALLDSIHAGVVDGMSSYLLSRLPPVGENEEEAPLRQILLRSFGAYRARKIGDLDWIESRILTAIQARKAQVVDVEDGWLDKVAGLTGVSVGTLHEISGLFHPDGAAVSTTEAMNQLLTWIEYSPARLLEFVRPENISGLFGVEYEKLETDEMRGNFALPVISQFLSAWMLGLSLREIEEGYPGRKDAARCKHARHFVLRLVPDLAFLAGLPAQLLLAKATTDEEKKIPLVISTLGTAVREGCDSPESLAARINAGRFSSRVAARSVYEAIKEFIPLGQEDESFDDTRTRLNQASIAQLFS